MIAPTYLYMGRHGETWGDMGRHGETWGDMGRYGEMWGDVGRCGEIWGDVGRCGEISPVHAMLIAHSWEGKRVGAQIRSLGGTTGGLAAGFEGAGATAQEEGERPDPWLWQGWPRGAAAGEGGRRVSPLEANPYPYPLTLTLTPTLTPTLTLTLRTRRRGAAASGHRAECL